MKYLLATLDELSSEALLHRARAMSRVEATGRLSADLEELRQLCLSGAPPDELLMLLKQIGQRLKAERVR